MSLDNEIVLVTGATRGIGKAIALNLAQQGAVVVGTATSEKGAETISAYLAENNYRGEGRVLDVSNAEAVNAFLKAMGNDIGAPTILVNNAGITRDNLLMRLSEEDWDAIINTNLSSVFRLSKGVIRGMLKAKRGRIISIASVVGATGNPGQTNYAAAKAGLMGFSKSLAKELAARGITVNVVAPGFIDTDMTKVLPDEQKAKLLESIPLNRLGSPEDIASAVGFLASTAAGYITGQTIHVNGGMYMA
ncbi:MAG: 3-oxoacyl-ACP reductase FabG [Gammaproteobacteria bacterium]|nr:3-oxoacyl-ACP reductase FabG [Gammaproteobacteria bacterium]